MAIDHTMTDAKILTRIRTLTGINTEEVTDTDMHVLQSIAIEWFQGQTSTTYAADTDDLYDNAVMYYTCYLASIMQNGVGIDSIRLGDIYIDYATDDPYGLYLDLALETLKAKTALSIKMGTYNADPSLGSVDWKKNIDGSDGTLTMKPSPKNTGYGDQHE